MKLLIIQLSDIHIKGKKDRVFSRAEKIVEAVRNISTKIELCIVAVTGDIAFSGTEQQYADSLDIFETLRVGLPTALNGARVEFLAIPGNHDCDFNSGSKVRKSVISTVKEDNEVDDSVIDAATIVQDNFFKLLHLYFNNHLEFHNRLYWRYKYQVNDYSLVFNCFNTAWVSELHEQPGTMFFPIEYVPESNTASSIVSIFHHPYNWQNPDNGRAFRKEMEAISDIILTGHEHDATARTTRSFKKKESSHIEAGALQDSNNHTTSEFNCVLIDTEEHRRAVLPFKWSENRYYSAYPIDSRWETYKVNSIRKINEFGLQEDFSTWVDDLGLQVKHPRKGILYREDIFVFPDLLEMGIRQSFNRKAINSEQFYEYIEGNPRVILTGTSDSGRTTLCKEIFKHYYDKHLIPIYLDGSLGKTMSGDERMITLLGRECESTYTNLTSEEYRQIDRSKRVVIIDNFDNISFKSGKRSVREILEFLTEFAGIVILAANDIAMQASEVLQEGFSFVTEGEAAFQQFKIQPFGHVLREQLIEQWVSFDTEVEDDIFRRINSLKSLLDTVIGNNFLPPYPVILLPLLQASQYHDEINLSASTYGYFYELLIKRSLTERTNRVSVDIKTGYLTFLARHMYERDVRVLSPSGMLSFHLDYENKYDIQVDYRDINNALIENNVLEIVKGDIQFKYDYIFYYFIASSFRDRLSDEDVQSTIDALVKALHNDLSANILLFLSHLTKDQFLIKKMLEAAAAVFPNVAQINSLKDLPLLADLKEVQDNIYYDEDVKAVRRKHNKYLDEVAAKYSEEGQTEQTDQETQLQQVGVEKQEAENDSDTSLDISLLPFHEAHEEHIAITERQEVYMKKISVAMKTLQILGQLLKNHVGTMERDTKTMLVNQCVGIGLRTLNSLILSLEPNREEFVRTMAIIFREQNPELTPHGATNQAVQSLFQIVHNNTYGAIKRISQAIGSPKLTRVYDRMLEQNPSPINKLVHAALYFDNTPKFPINVLEETYNVVENIPLGLAVLKSFTYNQFYTYNISVKTKQAACGILKVRYNPSVGSNNKEKLLKK